ncbi:protoporphyrinogen oxidase [Metamycoplasma cloacale]|uniref:peptide chain release factor N(5)-glutamine methyltransferase n=1 Tax=Metamycoplasma cloacale TaxID=92401 RepID=A0A2Z4LM43_9BACT|nr:peptide chain release factor N(5)-glutamine methyltransferase [Metamycoplasma cloacale]AWX42842.1 peptide chain release factor N(5)-glutamine methyltransferase [Metamycoplasma cloacale]VEU79337.1 protoporphyrinogen oxidase [Metamycoplasma cloacale]
MIEKEVLLREKLRYNLPLFVSKKELKLLKKDVPVQKIIGLQEMQNVTLHLNYNVLIPRYETEEVILECYQYLNKQSKVLDLGCGSGFIGLAIKKNINCDVTLVDKSRDAIKQTKHNAKLNGLDVKILKSNWFKKVDKKYDLIVSNPPYLNKNDTFSNSLKHEPKNALFAKNNGLYCYQLILKQAYDYLNDYGVLIFEIDNNASIWFKQNYPNVIIKKDINGKNRIAILKKEDLHF